MKRILGFITTSFLVLTVAATAFAVQESMMKKQPEMMMSKKPAMSKQRKQTVRRKVHSHRKIKKTIRKSAVK